MGFFGSHQIMILIVGRNSKLFNIDGLVLNSYDFVEHHYELDIVWRLLA